MGGHALDHFTVHRVVLILGRQIRTIHVEKLGAVKPDPGPTMGQERWDLLDHLHVSHELNQVAVLCFRRQVRVLEQLPLQRQRLLALGPVLLEGACVRVDARHAGETVHDQDVARLHDARDALQTHHGGNLERAGHDRRVGGLSTHVGDESPDARFVQKRRIGGGEIMRHDDHFPAGLLDNFLLLAHEVSHHAVGHEVEIAAALADILVVNHIEENAYSAYNHPQRLFGVHPVLADVVNGLVDDHHVVEDQEVGVDNEEMVEAFNLGDLVFDLEELLAGAIEGVPETLDLRLDSGGVDLILGNRHVPAVDDVGLADRNTRRCINARQHDLAATFGHVLAFRRRGTLPYSSPNLFSMSSPSRSTAARESSPSARTVTSLPKLAASVRIPMMLLPFTSMPSLPR